MTERYLINGREVSSSQFTFVVDSELYLDVPSVYDPVSDVKTFYLNK